MRPVLTGTGLAGPALNDAADLLAATEPVSTDFQPYEVVGRRGLRYKDEATRLALAAAARALRACGLHDGERLSVPAEHVAVVASSNLGNIDTVTQAAGTIARESVNALSPMNLPNASSNIVASSVAIWFGLRGPNLMVCNGASSGLDAIRWATVLLAAGRARHALVVGVEVDNEPVRALTGRDDLLHGAAAVTLEAPEAARAREAESLAEIGEHRRQAARDTGGTAGLTLATGHHRSESGSDVDLAARYGSASGALGVLQCVAAAAWLRDRPQGVVRALNGEGAITSLTLTRPGAA